MEYYYILNANLEISTKKADPECTKWLMIVLRSYFVIVICSTHNIII